MLKATVRLFVRYWLPLLCYSSLILFVSTIPSQGLPSLEIPDKLIHFCEYLLFGMLLYRLLVRDYHLYGRRLWIAHCLCVASFALADEWLQSFIPGRDSDLMDSVADISGGIIGAFCYCLIRRAWDRVRGSVDPKL